MHTHTHTRARARARARARTHARTHARTQCNIHILCMYVYMYILNSIISNFRKIVYNDLVAITPEQYFKQITKRVAEIKAVSVCIIEEYFNLRKYVFKYSRKCEIFSNA